MYYKYFLFSIVFFASTSAQIVTTGKSFFIDKRFITNQLSENKQQTSGTVFYSQSFNNSKIGQYLFFNGKDHMKFGPTKTTNNDTDVFGLNFLLDESFQGVARIAPKIQTGGFETQFFINLENIVSKLWFSASIPLVHTSYNPRLTSDVIVQNGATFDDHTFINGVNPSSAYSSIVEAFKGDKVLSDTHYTSSWQYGKIDGQRKKTGIGDVKLVLGYDILNKEKGFLKIGVLGILNGSNVSKAEYLFEPMIGIAGRYALGVCIDGKIHLHTCLHEKKLDALFHTNISHVFAKKMRRSYDYTLNGKGSRYLLVRRHEAYNALTEVDGILNSINITSLRAKLGINCLYDFHCALQLTTARATFNAGYGFIGHTQEKHKGWVDTIERGIFTFYAADNANAEGVGGSVGAVKLYPEIALNGTQGSAGTNMVDASDLAIAGITEKLLNKNSGLLPATIIHHFFIGMVHYFNKPTQPFIMLESGLQVGANNKSFDSWGIAMTIGTFF